LAGGVRPALERARQHAGHLVKIELEVDTLDQLAEALVIGVDAVLLDNMAPEAMRRAVAMVDGRAITAKAFGRVTLETAPRSPPLASISSPPAGSPTAPQSWIWGWISRAKSSPYTRTPRFSSHGV
jgi:hypothetical protein